MAVSNASNRSYDTGQPNLLYYWYILKRAKLLLLSVTVAFGLLGAGNALVTQKVYEAAVIIVPAEDKNRRSGGSAAISRLLGGSAGGLLSALVGPGQTSSEALATLKSRGFITRFIKDGNLLTKLYRPAAFDRDDPRDVPTLHDAYRKFKRALVIEEKPKEQIIRVKIHWKDPVIAADWANSLISKLNTELRNLAIAESAKRIEYLNRELEKTSILPLQQSIYRLIEAQTHSIMIAETREDYAFKVIDPAVPADLDRFIRPRRQLMVLVSAMMGFAIASFTAIWRDYLRRLKDEDQVERRAS